MTEPLPVTDNDVLAAWHALYQRNAEYAHIPNIEPGGSWLDQSTLAGLRRVLEVDRARVVAQQLQSEKGV